MAVASNLKSDFLKAASADDLTLLKRLASEFGTDAKGRNALHLAAAAGITEICKVLIEQLKFDVDSRDNKGRTPLIVAMKKQRNQTAEYLIEIGAGICCRDNLGFTALHHAAHNGHEGMLQLLLSKGAKVPPDRYSMASTPLHLACSHRRKECVKLLLDNGANPDSPAEICDSPLKLSIIAKSKDCMGLLLEAGANPNFSSNGTTPLIVAASEGDPAIIKHLMKAGANANIVDIFGVTPIEHAALRGNVAAVNSLFPSTSSISSFPDWSVDGIMKYVQSEEAKIQREIMRKNVFLVSKDKGRDAFEMNDYEEAKFWYSQANVADPTDANVLSNRSLCWAKLNQGSLAYIDAKACVALKPDWAKAHYRMGAALVLLNEHLAASVAFTKALNLEPNNKEIKQANREALDAGWDEWTEFIANIPCEPKSS